MLWPVEYSVYSDEGHSIVVGMSVKEYCEHQLIGIEEALVAIQYA